MQTLYVLIGAPAAGKSWATMRIREHRDVFVVCPDLIRALQPHLTRSYPPHKKVFAYAYQRMHDALGRGKSVLLDSTAANLLHRSQAIAFGKSHQCHVIGVWLDTPLDLCLSRHRDRAALASQSTLTPEIIAAYHSWLKTCPPTVSEGFDQLFRITPDDDIVTAMHLHT